MNDRDRMTNGNRSERALERIDERLDRIEMRFERIETRLGRMLRVQKLQLLLELRMAKEMDDLAAAVAHNTEVDESAITLLQGLKAQLDAAGTDPVKLKALSDSLSSSTDALAAAVAANTPTVPT